MSLSSGPSPHPFPLLRRRKRFYTQHLVSIVNLGSVQEVEENLPPQIIFFHEHITVVFYDLKKQDTIRVPTPSST